MRPGSVGVAAGTVGVNCAVLCLLQPAVWDSLPGLLYPV